MDGDGHAPTVSPPTCYRHPGRETWVTCVRCERPICPDCMVQAAVGFHCPDCARAGREPRRVARTPLGGPLRSRPGFVTITLIVINVVVFLLEQLQVRVQREYALLPASGLPHPYAGVAGGEYYRLLTAMFLHAGVAHIVFNMWALFVVGMPLESLLGRLRFTVLYLISGLGGSAAVYLFAPPASLTLGASGAIFGLFAALFVFGRRLNFDIRSIGLVIVVNLVLTFLI
ncbi:MAG: rhomboid family intramembrane serine protease, partial [Acidothermus sp.]|nr:rhomboid family intramembrane serine protease [Acidothermus sp.]